MKQLIWKAIKSSFGLYEFKISDYKADTLEEIQYKHDIVNATQTATLAIFIVLLFTAAGLIIINI